MKKVKIIGLSVNQDLGILKACNLKFDEKNRLIVVKGGVGEGKTTLQTALQLGTQGSKSLNDKKLYGEIDVETQLLDGETPVFVGCKTVKDTLQYVIYTKNSEGKKVKNPIIDGVSATPKKYLEMLQTSLTWRMDELTSDNPTVQKKILLELYQSELSKLGVVFDKKDSAYEGSILHQIEKAEEDRNYLDMKRKEKGGIKEDLIAKGYDPDRPDTIPDYIDLSDIDKKIQQLQTEIATEKVQFDADKEKQLSQIKLDAAEWTAKAIEYNSKLDKKYQKQKKTYDDQVENQKQIESISTSVYSQINELIMRGGLTNQQGESFIKTLQSSIDKKEIQEVAQPILFTVECGKIIGYSGQDQEAQKIWKNLSELRQKYTDIENQQPEINNDQKQQEIEALQQQKATAEETNKIVEAVDSFHSWRKANDEVLELKRQYVNKLAQVNTGVEGLKISEIDDEIFLTYNGKYDTKYFGNEEMEHRKLSAYSGTQKPVICLLIQEYLLSKKPKALKYIFMDNIPIDTKTRVLIEKMATELDITVFLNITGDFNRENIGDDILIDGGEVFFEG